MQTYIVFQKYNYFLIQIKFKHSGNNTLFILKQEEVFRIHSSDDDDDDEGDEGNLMEPVGEDMDSDIEGKGDNDRDGLPSSKAWGKKRKNYYHTDYVDQDYGGM